MSRGRTVCAEPGCPGLSDHDHRYCPDHQPAIAGAWSRTRDRGQQARFRAAVLRRDHHACVDCGATTDLRACHITPLAEGGSYHPDNGVTRCARCDRKTDPHAR